MCPDGGPSGFLGEVDPGVLDAFDIVERVAWIELDLQRLLTSNHGADQVVPISRFPSSDVDLAFEVDEGVSAAALETTIVGAAGELLARLALFDVYRGPGVAEGRRSLAYTLRLQAPDRTLTDAVVAEVRERVIAAVEEAHPATLRR